MDPRSPPFAPITLGTSFCDSDQFAECTVIDTAADGTGIHQCKELWFSVSYVNVNWERCASSLEFIHYADFLRWFT